MNKHKSRKTTDLIIQICIIILLALLNVCSWTYYFTLTHFLPYTKIEGDSYAGLTIEDSIEKINLKKREETITFCFANGKTYDITLEKLNVQVDETRVAQFFKQQHTDYESSREYELDGFILADTEALREFLVQIPELQEENMVYPEDACIIWNGEEFVIKKEVWGSRINFDNAFIYAMEEIKNDEKEIDFSLITYKETPNILAKDLLEEVEKLDSILKSSINFELSNGEIVTLDYNIIRNWIYQDETGKFAFNIEHGVQEFVEELAAKTNEANSFMEFAATDCEQLATVNVPVAVRAQLDKESEIAGIKSLLGNSEPIYKQPIYDRTLIRDRLISYVEIDISRQHVWFYLNGVLLVDSPCVTGNVRDGNGTPTGVFFLIDKREGALLEGFNNDGTPYSSPVEYWIKFYRGIGMHDASWRSQFGGEIYLTGGSHGCVNMPKDKVSTIYEAIDDTMPIIVYKSEL